MDIGQVPKLSQTDGGCNRRHQLKGVEQNIAVRTELQRTVCVLHKSERQISGYCRLNFLTMYLIWVHMLFLLNIIL